MAAKPTSYWITGPTGSGKTARLLQQFQRWRTQVSLPHPQTTDWQGRSLLVFAATGDNRIALVDRITGLSAAGDDPIPTYASTTPLGFFYDEVVLFWPLLLEQLQRSVRFPLRLRPETEQMLATERWQPLLEEGVLQPQSLDDYRLVRRLLDLLQLAGSAGVPVADIPLLLRQGISSELDWAPCQAALEDWQRWCLDRGLLTYGIVSDLYWRVLLPHPTYRQQLSQRYAAALADDVDNYPAIAAQLFDVLLDAGLPGLFTFDPDGDVRWGVGGDAGALAALQPRCQTEAFTAPLTTLQPVGQQLWAALQTPLQTIEPATGQVLALQTGSRAALLRQVATTISGAIAAGEVPAQEIAIIGPGLDSIARYALTTILTDQGIAVTSLNDQQPIVNATLVRSLLTLMALVYPHLGRLLTGNAVAEMLIALTAPPQAPREMAIDPVRAGLIVDHCFQPDPDHPQLLPLQVFPQWERVGYQASEAYERLRLWVEAQQTQRQQRLLPSPVTLLDRAIQQFLYGGTHLPIDAQSSLRELMETAQHYWEVDARLQSTGRQEPGHLAIARFVQLLQAGTITADPYPVRPLKPAAAVTLATAYQYRALRLAHRWHFWLDVGSPLWLTGAPPLFAAPVFLQSWPGRQWTAADELAANQARLRRSLMDLAGRVGERLYLCHSDLSTSGQDQSGPLVGVVGQLPEAGLPASG
ncbi:MAG: recombinase family protein [Cyanobacteria bacterium P01_A01_bin.135]